MTGLPASATCKMSQKNNKKRASADGVRVAEAKPFNLADNARVKRDRSLSFARMLDDGFAEPVCLRSLRVAFLVEPAGPELDAIPRPTGGDALQDGIPGKG